VGDGVHLITNNVVEAVGNIGVDEAVANPLTSSDAIIVLAMFVESIPIESKHTSR
jgi:hypothetical protein